MTAKEPPGVAAQPARKWLILGTPCRCTPKGLAKIRGFGEARYRQISLLPGNRTMQTRLPRRVLLYGCLSRGPRVKGTRARDIPRAPRACPIIVSPSTRQALTLTQGAARTLTTWPRMQCSWESEQYKNWSGGMVPLCRAGAGPRA